MTIHSTGGKWVTPSTPFIGAFSLAEKVTVQTSVMCESRAHFPIHQISVSFVAIDVLTTITPRTRLCRVGFHRLRSSRTGNKEIMRKLASRRELRKNAENSQFFEELPVCDFYDNTHRNRIRIELGEILELFSSLEKAVLMKPEARAAIGQLKEHYDHMKQLVWISSEDFAQILLCHPHASLFGSRRG